MIQNSKNCPPPPPSDSGCEDCNDKDNATQKSINSERQVICTLLYDTEGNVVQQQTKFDGENAVFNEKKCMFLHTEENYRRYRNLEISAGTELLQTNDSIKTNVAALNKLNTDLNKALTDISKQIKDAKSKFADLKYAACKLDDSITDKCNAAQWKALTGKTTENCNDGTKPPAACENTESEINNLICFTKGLGKDIDYIFQSSADVTGIQMFSNIDTLDPLQKTLSDKSNAFEKLISDTMKTRKSELDKLQSDLVDSIKSITQSAMDRNSMRSDFEGYFDTAHFLCCPPCDCINNNPNTTDNAAKDASKDDCNPRLQGCGSKICEICKEVQITFCCDTPDNPDKKCD
jgi:gas vesicle protein